MDGDIKKRKATLMIIITQVDNRRSGRAVLQLYAQAQLVQLFLRHNARNLNKVGFVNLMARVHQRLCQSAVIRQQQQSFGIEVQAANRENSLRQVLHEIGNTAAVLRVGHRGDNSPWLIEHVISLGFLGNRLAVNADAHLVGIKLAAQLGNHLTVHADAACRNNFFCFAAGGNACCRQDFL